MWEGGAVDREVPGLKPRRRICLRTDKSLEESYVYICTSITRWKIISFDLTVDTKTGSAIVFGWLSESVKDRERKQREKLRECKEERRHRWWTKVDESGRVRDLVRYELYSGFCLVREKRLFVHQSCQIVCIVIVGKQTSDYYSTVCESSCLSVWRITFVLSRRLMSCIRKRLVVQVCIVHDML